jgi:hypothetical protein
VSCASAGNCAAVGYYDDSSGHQHGLLLSESSGTWATGVEATPPANAASPSSVAIYGVSCASVGNCAAIGNYVDISGNEQGLLLSESSATWARGVEATLPANAATASNGVGIGSVSCASAGDCAAVGGYTDSFGHGQGLLLTENSGRWAPGVEATLPANAARNPRARARLTGVGKACVRARFTARVTGSAIASVRWLLDGRPISGRAVRKGTLYVAAITLTHGSHRLTVKVTFKTFTRASVKIFKRRVAECTTSLRKFTG